MSNISLPIKRAVRLLREATDECLDDALMAHGGDCVCDRCLEIAVAFKSITNAARDLERLCTWKNRNGAA